jgi:hypothetical protein
MTRDEFIQILDENGYSYKIEGDSVVITHKGNVNLISLMSLPPGVEFNNSGGVYLNSLTSLPPGVAFKNGRTVDLRSLTSLPPGVKFENRWGVNLESLIDGFFYYWEGNIEGIDGTRLLNLMISKGLFER